MSEQEQYIPEDAGNVTPQENIEGQQVEGQPEPQQQANVPQDKDFDPTQFGYQYKGRQFLPKDRNHIIALMQKGHGFNSEYEKVKQDKAQVDELRGQYDNYAKFDESLKGNPKFNAAFWDWYNKYQGGQVDDAGQDVPPEVQEVRQTKDEITAIQKQINDTVADRKLHEEISQLRGKYQQDWDKDDGHGTLEQKILKHALDNNFPTLESAYRDFNYDSLQAATKAEAFKQSKENRQAQYKAGKIGTGVSPQGAPNNGYQKGDDYNDLVNKVMKET